MQYFQDHQDQYNAPDDQFRTLANNAPYPSEACCAAAKQFVGQKCSCDGPTLGNAQQARTLGFPAEQQVFNDAILRPVLVLAGGVSELLYIGDKLSGRQQRCGLKIPVTHATLHISHEGRPKRGVLVIRIRVVISIRVVSLEIVTCRPCDTPTLRF